MHIGGLTLVEGPPPAMDEFLEQIRRRLHLVPRYRHKLAYTALDSGRPVWVDDPSFNLEYHVRHTALPAPGTWEQLQDLTARIFSQQLDRSKPLWEMWLIEGLEDDRFALITKTHHSLIDGIAGVDLATVLFDLSRTRRRSPTPGAPWQPHAEPGTAQLLAAGLHGAVRAGVALAEGALDALAHPERAMARAREAAEGIGEIVWAGLNPAPETPLNVPIGPHRRFVGRDRLAGGLQDRQERLRRHRQRRRAGGRGGRAALLPDLARAAHGGRGDARARARLGAHRGRARTAGNRIVVMRGPLPVYIGDPLNRLRFVSQAMDGLKESKQALGAEVIAGAQNFAPPTILAQASRLNFSTRLFNLIVTNVPGPQFPLYVLGREMVAGDPRRLPARKPRARDRDHVLQRADELRPAGRLRRAARHRRDR